MNDLAELNVSEDGECVASVAKALAPPWGAAFCLGMLKAAYRTGDLARMRRIIEERFADSPKTAEQMAEFERVLAYMEEMESFERQNGPGSCRQPKTRGFRIRIERMPIPDIPQKSSWEPKPC